MGVLRGIRFGTRHVLTSRTISQTRQFSTAYHFYNKPVRAEADHVDVADLLSRPSWSVSSLLPRNNQQSEQPSVTSKQLHHLLRLSALPPPKDANEEDRMLATLSSQLHFVKEIQSVDTTGVEPLRSLRDESQSGEQEAELGMDALKTALNGEEVRGKHHKRIRRRKDDSAERVGHDDDWDVLGTAGRKVGRFFVVEGGKDR